MIFGSKNELHSNQGEKTSSLQIKPKDFPTKQKITNALDNKNNFQHNKSSEFKPLKFNELLKRGDNTFFKQKHEPKVFKPNNNRKIDFIDNKLDKKHKKHASGGFFSKQKAQSSLQMKLFKKTSNFEAQESNSSNRADLELSKTKVNQNKEHIENDNCISKNQFDLLQSCEDSDNCEEKDEDSENYEKDEDKSVDNKEIEKQISVKNLQILEQRSDGQKKKTSGKRRRFISRYR